jgi:proteasome lid subunit RPN8/RPN11
LTFDLAVVAQPSIRVGPQVLRAISAHAGAEAPRECCGLLIGSDRRIDEVVPAGNCAADPLRRYEIDPRDYIAAIKRCRGTSSSVLGAYHSHPRSAAEPSPTDLAEAFGEFLYVIAGPVIEGSVATIRAYRLMDGNFRPVELVPDPEEGTP